MFLLQPLHTSVVLLELGLSLHTVHIIKPLLLSETQNGLFGPAAEQRVLLLKS